MERREERNFRASRERGIVRVSGLKKLVLKTQRTDSEISNCFMGSEKWIGERPQRASSAASKG